MSDTTSRLRQFLAAILLLGMGGSGVDLLLLAHHEDIKQLIPLILLGAGVAALGWSTLAKSRASVRALQFVMALLMAAGLVGVILHLRSSMEFQAEIDPSLTVLELVMKAMRAKAPPALAPGVMVQLGLIGLASTYKHPALLDPPTEQQTRNTT